MKGRREEVTTHPCDNYGGVAMNSSERLVATYNRVDGGWQKDGTVIPGCCGFSSFCLWRSIGDQGLIVEGALDLENVTGPVVFRNAVNTGDAMESLERTDPGLQIQVAVPGRNVGSKKVKRWSVSEYLSRRSEGETVEVSGAFDDGAVAGLLADFKEQLPSIMSRLHPQNGGS